MPHIVLLLGTAIATFAVLLAGSAILSRVFVSRSIRKLIASVGRERLPSFSKQLTSSLPEPIRRYLAYALREGQPNIRYGVLRQRAEFRHGPERPWFSVKAKEVISGMEPAFVWDAVLRHNKLWWRTAKLSYFQGRGSGHIKLYGAVTLQEVEGPETDTSMLFRFLSELVWVPTGLLPTKTLRWEAIDANTARAVITDGQTTVTADVHVNDIGQIEKITTKSKYRDLKSGFEQLAFTLQCHDYTEVDGVKIPMGVTFVWNMPTGDFSYGKFRVEDIRYVYD
ncbi:MAG: hypothetical protein FGM24_06475 [Candidatus Kapabacteria bacterium]|nr:hypothetical protein [Candidatus Kapabacteria bacterium]